MHATRIFLSVIVLSLFASAQDAGQAQQAPAVGQGKATVYVYRYKQFTGSALAPSVYCDEVELARMENGRYFAVKLDPGKHVFRSNDKQAGVALDAKAGQEYYVRVEIAAGVMKGHGRLIMMTPEQGRYELGSSKLKPLDADKVQDKAHVSVEMVNLTTEAGSAAPASQSPSPEKQ